MEAGDRGDWNVGVCGDNSDEADDGKMVCTLAWLEEEEEEAPHPRIHTPRSLLASRHLRTRTGGPSLMIINKKYSWEKYLQGLVNKIGMYSLSDWRLPHISLLHNHNHLQSHPHNRNLKPQRSKHIIQSQFLLTHRQITKRHHQAR